MNKKKNNMVKRVLAFIMAVLMVLGTTTVGSYNVSAEIVPSYTVNLVDGNGDVIELSGADIKMTNMADTNDTVSVEASNGMAVFSNSLILSGSYKIEVTGLLGYKVTSVDEIVVAIDSTSTNVPLSVLPLVTVSGTIKNENNFNYSGAVITALDSASGHTVSDTSATNGNYSFQVYQGQTYNIKVAPADRYHSGANYYDIDKYETTELKNDVISADTALGTTKLTVKTFSINTSVANDVGGTISSLTPTEPVLFDGNTKVTVTPETGYKVKSLTINGTAVSAAVGKTAKYEYTMYNIRETKNVVVTYELIEFKITAFLGANGEFYNSNDLENKIEGTHEVDGGSVTTKYGLDTSVCITPAVNFRINNIEIDYVEVTIPESGSYTHIFEDIDSNHRIDASFINIKKNIEISSVGNGKICIGTTEKDGTLKVNAGSSTALNIVSDEGYCPKIIKIDGTSIMANDSNLAVDEQGNVVYTFSNIQDNHIIDVEFYAIPTITLTEADEVNESNYYTLQFTTLRKASIDAGATTREYILSNPGTMNIEAEGSYFGLYWKYNNTASDGTFSLEKDVESTKTVTSIQMMKNRVADLNVSDIFSEVILTRPIKVVVDTVDPSIGTLAKNPTDDWTNGTVNVSTTASDTGGSGEFKVRYSKTETDYDDDSSDEFLTPTIPQADDTIQTATFTNNKYSFNLETEPEGEVTYYVWAIDLAGNKSAMRQVDLKFDYQLPTIDSFSKAPLNQWTNDTVNLYGAASDKGGSTVEEIRYSNKENAYENDTYKVNKGEVVTLVDGEYSFMVDSSNDRHDTYYVWAYDKAGNKSIKSDPIGVNIDKTLPTVDSITKDPATLWTDGAVGITVKVSDKGADYNSGVAKICYIPLSANAKEEDLDKTKAVVMDITQATETTEVGSTFKFVTPTESGKAKEFSGKYYVWTVDVAGNKSNEHTIDVNIDTTDPIISGFEIKKLDFTVPADFINYLSFGSFYNNKVEVIATASDYNISSGVDYIILYGDDKVIESKKVDTQNKASFELSVPFNKTLTVASVDVAGRKSKVTLPTAVNAIIKDSKLMLEKTIPEVSITPATAVYADSSGKKWYSKDEDLNIVVKDVDSGINAVNILINGKAMDKDKNNKSIDAAFYNAQTLEEKFVVNTAQGEINSEGYYKIEVKVTDNAGNTYSDSKTVYKDIIKPEIVDFKFTATGNQEATGKLVEELDYGFYFVEDTTVVISAKDAVPTSGVKSITYYTVDYSNSINGIKSEVVSKNVNEKNQISMVIPANFKGQIYAIATDNALNSLDQYVKPDGSVIENATLHTKTSSISLEAPTTINKDNNDLDLYANDVSVGVAVVDSYSGIKKIEWSVVSGMDIENNQSGTVNIDNSGTLSGDTSGWEKVETDINLVTKMKNTIKVKNDSNDIKVLVKLTDRAGNTSNQEIKFSIDKVKPTIDISYDNNAYDPDFIGETEFYKADHTATVVITERNFNAEDVIITMANVDGAVPTVSKWTESKNSSNPDLTTYTAKIPFSVDGDYTCDISFADLAKNAASKVDTQTFTIDETVPEISVAYDNNAVASGNFYAKERKATITIKEHNFETTRFVLTGSATQEGETVATPAVSAWSSSGDIHTATINYAEDAFYTLKLDYTDKAGNQANEFEEQNFYVDKTIPTLEITGVTDKSANKGDVIPVVTYSDINLDAANASISLSASNQGKLAVNGAYKDIENGKVLTFDNFERKQKVDDIYTLKATITDKAGNKIEQTVVFSVNRFGSVYVFADDFKAIEGKYVQEELDIVITETNVDKLDMEKIKVILTKNGTPTDLEEQTDYTIDKSGGEGDWSQYKYNIKAKNFEGDAKYIITLCSVDAAGNVNENIDEAKQAEAWFGVDKTAPVVVPLDLEEGKTYAVESKTVSISATDNLVLSSVQIFVNEVETKYETKGEEYTFDIGSSNSTQKVKIVATDAAGNEILKEVKNFYVTKNILVRWYTNKTLFVGSVGGAVTLSCGGAGFLWFRKVKIV